MKYIRKVTVTISLFMAFFSGFAQQTGSKSFDLLLKSMVKGTTPLITVQELKNKATSPVLLDAREKKEFDVSHLKGAKWVGYDTFSLEAVKNLPKDSPIVVYCSIGVRSEKIGDKLRGAGFTNVQNLYGSIFEWVNQGNPVYDNQNKPTKKVHAYNKMWGMWLSKGEKVY
ncbi:MAG: rhodanese-like domain-containing protein [Spirosomataceae bacterium]